MKTFLKKVKRCVAFLMAFTMVLSASGMNVFAQTAASAVAHDDAIHTTLGELIVSNYDLTGKEESIISSGTLSADKGYSYILPPEEVADGGLISVDEETKKITASVYEDAEGNLWVPVSFDLKNAHGVIAGHDDLPLSKNGNVFEGEYTYEENQFSVEVSYKLEITVSETEQQEMLDAGEKLAADIAMLKILDSKNIFPENDPENAVTYAKIQAMVDEALGYHAILTPELVLMFMVADALEGKSVVDVIYELSQESDDKIVKIGEEEFYLYMTGRRAQNAAANLFNQQETNHNLDLAKFLEADHAMDSYLERLMLYGQELKDALVSNYDDISYLAGDAGLQQVSDELDYLLVAVDEALVQLEDGLVELDEALNTINTNLATVESTLAQVEDGLAQLESFDLFAEINKEIANAGYDLVIEDEDHLNALITEAETVRAQKLGELNTLLGQLGYSEEIKNADDIDAAIAFLETYDPYAPVEAAVNAELQKQGLSGILGTVSIKNAQDIDSLIATLSAYTSVPGVGPKAQAAINTLTAGKENIQTFETNKPTYIAQLQAAQTELRSGDEKIAVLKDLRDVKLPAAKQELANKKAEAESARTQLLTAKAQLLSAKTQAEDAKALALATKAEALTQKADAQENKQLLDMLIMIMNLLCDTMEPVYDTAKADAWNAPSVLDTQKNPNYDQLTTWATDLVKTDVTVKENLSVTSAVVRYNMSMYNVHVVVKGSKVDPALLDSTALVDLPEYHAPVITLRKGVDKQEVLDAIAELAADAAALAQPQWNGVITTANFDRTADELADDFELTADLVYTITYTPKDITVSYGEGFDAGHGLPTTVPYGYQLTLPKHDDAESEYIYTVNGTDNLDQGTVVLVTENTSISRKQGAMSEKQYLTTLVVKTNPEMDTTLQSILLSDAIVKGNGFSIVVPKNENLQVYLDEETRQFVIKALPLNSRVGSLQWTATDGRLDSTPITLTNGVHNTTAAFDMAYVDYKLALTASALGISEDDLLEVMNIPYNLSEDYKNQSNALDGLAAQLSYLKKINNYDTVETPLGTNTVPELLMSVAALAAAPDSGFLATTPDAARNLAALIRANGTLPIVTTLEGYQANGLYDFYINEQTYLAQINELHDLLALVVVDDKLMGMLPAEYKTGFTAAQIALEEAYKLNSEYAIDHDIVIVREDTKPALRRLLNDLAVAQAEKYTQVPGTMTWVQTVSATSPGKASITINVVFDGATFSDLSWSAGIGTDLDRAELERRIAALTQQAGLADEMKVHYDRTMTGDSDLVAGPQTITVTWTAKEYPVYVDGVSLGNVTIDGGKIQLPAHPVPGYVYEYTIGGDETRAAEYNFSTAKVLAMLQNGQITITRTAINVAETELINKANSMGVTLVKDPQEGYIMVLPLDMANVQESIMPFALGLFASGSTSIKLGDDDLLYNNQYYLEALVSAILNTGIDSNRIQTLIDGNGNVVSDLNIPAEQILNGRPGGAQGGTLLKTTLSFDNGAPIGFYVTLNGSGERLLQVRNLVAQAQGLGIEFALKDGMVQVIGDLPEPVYAAYVAALTMVGEADIDNVNALNAEVAVGYLVDLVDNAITDDVTSKTILNTTSALGRPISLPDNIFNLLKTVLKNKQVRYDANDDSVAYADLNGLSIKSIIDRLQLSVDNMQLPAGMTAPQLSSMIAEYNTGLDVTVKADIQNMDKEYVAMSVNASALKAKDINGAVKMLTVDELANVANDNAIILLDNVGTPENPVALTLNNRVVLDLNGKKFYGDITTGSSRAFIVDSDYKADAYVSGAVSGSNLTILSGKYAADVTAYLKTGYRQVNGVVSNKYVTLTEQNGDILVVVNAVKAREIATREHLLALALDVLSELAITHYNTAAMTVDGKTLFDLNAENILGMLTGTNRMEAAIDTVLGCVDAPELAELVDVLVADITNFAQLKKALETDGVLAEYDFTTSAWDVAVERNTQKDTLDVSLRSGKTLEQGKLKLILTGDFNGELATLAGALADTTTVTSDFTNVKPVTYDNGTFTVAGDYAGSVTMDFSKDYRYSVVMSVILAGGNEQIRDELVAALEAFYDTGCTNQNKLEVCFDKLTLQQVITALENHSRAESFESIAKRIGLSQDTLDQVLQLGNDEMGFYRVVDLAGIALRRISIDRDGVLGSLKKTDAQGKEYYGADLARTFSRDFSIRSFIVDVDANLTELSAALYLFADHVHEPGTPVEENRVPAQCEQGGSYEMVTYCTVCGEKLKVEVVDIPQTGHAFTNYVSNGDATCMADGTKTAECDNGCGTKDTIADVGSKLEHVYTNYVSNNDATCFADGTKTASCDYGCGTQDTIADVGSKLEHVYTNYVSNGDATCMADGTKTAECDNGCGTKDTIADVGSKLDHVYTSYASNGDATCMADGTKTAECDYGCGTKDTIADVGSKLDHVYTNYVSNNDATCFADGTKTASCDYGCGTQDTIADVGSKLEHKFTNYVSNGDATCFADGTKTASCDYGCGTQDTIADVGSKLEHVYTNYVSNGDATCFADGTKTASCDHGCGTQDTIADVGSKLEHVYTNYVSNNDATCEADGTKTAECDNGCGTKDTVTDVGSKKDHGTTTLVGYRPADRGVPGYTGDLVCDACGHVVTPGSEIQALPYEIEVKDSNGDYLYKGADLEAALAAVQNGSVMTLDEIVNQANDLSTDKDFTIVGADKINANGKKILLTDPAAKITADAALNVFSGVDGYIAENNNNVYTLKQIAAPAGDSSVAGVKVDSDASTRYLFLDLEPVNGKTLSALETSLTFADLTGYTVKLAISGNDGTGLVKTADTMIATALDANGNVVATITYTVVVMGDVNCDGLALSDDTVALMQIYFGNVNATKPMLLAADINCDGTIDAPVIGADDAHRIMFKYFNWGKAQGGYTTALR